MADDLYILKFYDQHTFHVLDEKPTNLLYKPNSVFHNSKFRIVVNFLVEKC